MADQFAANRWTLLFKDSKVEREFVRRSTASTILYFQLYLIFGVGLYTLFGILDFILIPERYLHVWAVRYFYVCPALLIILFVTFSSIFERWAQKLAAIVMIVAGTGIIMMTTIIEMPYRSHYYVGLILVLIYCSSMIGLRLIYYVAISLSLLSLYAFTAIYIAPIPGNFLLNNLYFLVSANAIGIFSNYVMETYLRRSFVAENRIELQKEELIVLLSEAEAANRAKSEFLAVMSHELRTPLNAIIGFSELISRQIAGPLGSPKYHEYAQDIHNSGVHLLSIINDILDLAKAEAGKLQLSDDEFELERVLERSVRMCEPLAESRGVRVSSKTDAGLLLCADERLIRQVLINLISNAIKFTPDKGTVTIDTTTTISELIIRITDTGVGIPAKDLDRILRPFEQVEGALSRRHGGTGLGLPYSKRIIEIHGGALKLKSEVSRGTIVEIHLPMTRVRHEPPPNIQAAV